MTFLAAPSATMQFDIAGFKAQGTQTVLNLEFGPDGNGTANPSPDPNLPAGVSFVLSRTINGVLISKTFSKAGIDDLTTFPGKEIIFNHPTDATNAPGFYKLTVVHTQDVPVGTTETWNLAISGLPTTGLRTQGAIIQGIFKSLTPVAPALGTPAIAIGPAPVAAGTTPTLKIASFGGFDLSQVTAGNVSISGTGVSNPQVSGATATGLNLAFSLARCAAGGNRTVSITRNALTASTPFTVTALPPPAISISPSAFTQGTTTNMTVSSNSCLDMSHATATISGDGITVTPLGGATVNALTLSVAVTATASVTARTLQVTADGGSATAPVQIAQAAPPPPPPPVPDRHQPRAVLSRSVPEAQSVLPMRSQAAGCNAGANRQRFLALLLNRMRDMEGSTCQVLPSRFDYRRSIGTNRSSTGMGALISDCSAM